METPQTLARSLPHLPGVYIFKDGTGVILYVGKAKDLKRRVRQYFDGSHPAGSKTAQLVPQICGIDTIQTHSEFDALILEAKLIREHNPKYNIISKDDKSPLYLCITFDEELPHIEYVRKSSIITKSKRLYFGPFQSGRILKNVLRQLRRIIPYCTQKKRDGRPCFYTHLGLCRPCPSALARMEEGPSRVAQVKTYRAQVRKIANIMSGESLTVLHDMEDEMRKLAARKQYEEAHEVKTSIERFQQLLQKHYDPSLYVQGDSFLEDVYGAEMHALRAALIRFYPKLTPLARIECIDISNTMGQYSTGSLVVLQDGLPARSDYRRFRIRTKDAPNDVAMIAEVVSRRMKHADWPIPDLLVIDGGKGQVAAAMAAILSERKRVEGSLPIDIPVIGLAKRFEEIVVPENASFKIIKLPVDHKGLHLLQRVRDESHRFALTYHRLLRKKGFLPSPQAPVGLTRPGMI